jgi:uncharacterized membrane protein
MYSIGGSVVLLYFNILSILAIIDFFKPFLSTETNYKLHVIVSYAILAAFNYFVLYRKKRYIEVFDYFDEHKEKYKKWNKSVPAYIICSVIVMLVIVAIAMYRHGTLFPG